MFVGDDKDRPLACGNQVHYRTHATSIQRDEELGFCRRELGNLKDEPDLSKLPIGHKRLHESVSAQDETCRAVPWPLAEWYKDIDQLDEFVRMRLVVDRRDNGG